MKYIDTDKLKEKIYAEDTVSLAHGSLPEFDQGCHYAFLTVLSLIDSLQQEQDLIVINKKDWEAQEQFQKNKDFGKPLQQEQPDKESLNESQQEFVNIVTERMLKEGPIPTLKGKQKAEFEKEFNRFKQIAGMVNWPAYEEIYKKIILWFMAWGADNFPNLNKVTDSDKLDFQQEQPNDVCAEIEEYYGEELAFEDERTKAAYHFFSAGKAFELREYEEERKRHITDLLDAAQKGMNAGYEKAISELKEGKVECSPVMKELIDKLFGIGNTFNFGFGPKNIQQEQSETDLNADIQMVWDSFNKHLNESGEESEDVVWLNWNSFADVARYFYELGLNARKEEKK